MSNTFKLTIAMMLIAMIAVIAGQYLIAQLLLFVLIGMNIQRNLSR